mgnify:CR=1 FL=1
MSVNVLELFAGSRSIGAEAEKQGCRVFSSDITPYEGIDYPIDINMFNVEVVPFIPDVIWASPPCTYFSVASIGKHWHADHTPKSENALRGVEFVSSTLSIIEHFLGENPSLKWFMENPRGKLRKLSVVSELERITVWYCKYASLQATSIQAKPTDIWSNNIRSIFNPDGWQPRPQCKNGNTHCPHEEAPRGSRTGIQGVKGNYLRSKIPNELCREIILSCL